MKIKIPQEVIVHTHERLTNVEYSESALFKTTFNMFAFQQKKLGKEIGLQYSTVHAHNRQT